MKVAIIGGGAAGFFAAIRAKELHADAEVVILEKSNKLLSKVKVSGGGRCNVTNGETSIKQLSNAYPRGGKALKKMFGIFNTKDTRAWFEKRGVSLMVQDDNCVFPVSQDSQSIIDCFLGETDRLGIHIKTKHGVYAMKQVDKKLILSFDLSGKYQETYDKVIVATGGSPKRKGLEWLEKLGHEINDPVPSLFTFNMPKEKVKSLMGVVIPETKTSIQGTKLKSNGPLLITHWGMSGPSILKLSSYGARVLSEKNYEFKLQVSWVNETNNQEVTDTILSIVDDHGKKQLSNFRPYQLPDRLWLFLLDKIKLLATKRWEEIGKKGINKIVNVLTNDVYLVNGKTTFKEEFVTCGGVSLGSIDLNTMSSRVVDNLYFAGEVLDIDGITGGYNFQSAWTTGFIAGNLG